MVIDYCLVVMVQLWIISGIDITLIKEIKEDSYDIPQVIPLSKERFLYVLLVGSEILER